MGNFDRRGKRSGGGRDFGGKRSFGGRDRDRSAMHKATCSECGNSCELPFRPSGDRPVFCNACFGKQDNGGRPNKFRNERREKPRSRDSQMHNAVCDECGKDCQVPFRPTGDKPIYCDNCFGKGDSKGKSRAGSDGTMEQIKILSAKIDELIKILAPTAPVEKKEKVKEEKKEKVEKKEKTKTKATAKKVSTKKKK